MEKILLSGLRATVLMKDGKELDKEKITKALTAQGLSLVSMEKENILVPESAYVLAVTGTG